MKVSLPSAEELRKKTGENRSPIPTIVGIGDEGGQGIVPDTDYRRVYHIRFTFWQPTVAVYQESGFVQNVATKGGKGLPKTA